MKIRSRSSTATDKIELQMTPMIDIVFQLLSFFILTFRVVATEGDFNIRMPTAAAAATKVDTPESITLQVRMRADDEGNLTSLSLDKSLLTKPASGTVFDALHHLILERLSDPSGPKASAAMTEVEFDCDYKLKYEYVISAITAVSGYRVGTGDDAKTVRLIEKIKFAPAKGKPGKSS